MPFKEKNLGTSENKFHTLKDTDLRKPSLSLWESLLAFNLSSTPKKEGKRFFLRLSWKQKYKIKTNFLLKS